jgi:hypothetical protein
MPMRPLLRPGLAAALLACAATSCTATPTTPDTAGANNPTTVAQDEVLAGFSPVADPLAVFSAGLYNILRQPKDDSVAITGYTLIRAAGGTTARVANFAYRPASGTWESLPRPELVWAPGGRRWIDTDRTERLSPGPAGSRGFPTVKAVADYGTTFYTLSSADLGGTRLSDGLERGFAQGGQLPASIQNATFSRGARSYTQSVTYVDPLYTIQRIKNAATNGSQFMLLYACAGKQSPQKCDTPASSVAVADPASGQSSVTVGALGRFTNFAGTTRLELVDGGKAVLRPVGSSIPLATFTYRVVSDDGPARITLQASNAEDAKKFGAAIGIDIEHFAFYDYEGLVAAGTVRPAGSSSTSFAGYNQIAASDLVTRWTPPLPPVSP